MRNSEKPRFCEVLAGLQLIKPGVKLTDAAYEIWWNAMRADWTIEEFTAAASHLASAVEFMPSPFHFAQLRKASKPTAAEAWAAVLKRCLNWRNPIENPDVIDRAVAGIGGYRAIAMADTEHQLPHFQHKFVAAYNELDGAVEVRQALPNIAPMPGLNARDGKFTPISAPTRGGNDLVPKQ